METKFTPAPWLMHESKGAGIRICAPVYRVEGVELPKGMPEAPICVFELAGPAIVAIAFDRFVQFEPNAWGEMQTANARLIIAAPDLYEALDEAINYVAVMASTLGDHSHAAFLDKATAALSKARGEQ